MNKVWVIFAKELIDSLRDYRSWATGLFWAVFGPLMMGGMMVTSAGVPSKFSNTAANSDLTPGKAELQASSASQRAKNRSSACWPSS